METYKEILFMSILMEIVNEYDLPNKKILIIKQLKKLFTLEDHQIKLLIEIMDMLYEIADICNSDNYYNLLCDILHIL